MKRKIFFATYWPILFYGLMIAALLLGNRSAFTMYLVIAMLVIAIIRVVLSDRKYLIGISTIADSLYIEYMTPLFQTRSVEFNLSELVKVEKNKIHWITRQPAAILFTFTKGWAEFYIADRQVFDKVSEKLAEAKMSLL